MSYSIGQAAKLLGIAPSTLRFYDKEGLLPFMERNKNGVKQNYAKKQRQLEKQFNSLKKVCSNIQQHWRK